MKTNNLALTLKSGLALAALLVCLTTPGITPAQTVIDVPPTSFGDDESVGSDTTLNVSDTGTIGNSFSLGDETSTGIVANISGGTIGDAFMANNGTLVRITGGAFGENFSANGGSVVKIDGPASFGNGFIANTGSTVKISDGIFGTPPAPPITGGGVLPTTMFGTAFTAVDGSVVKVNGGTYNGSFVAQSGSFVRVTGGMFDEFFAEEGSEVVVVAPIIFLDGVPLIDEQVVLDRDVLLTGFFDDGTPFEFNLAQGFFDTDSMLTVIVIPEPSSMLLVLSSLSGMAACIRRRR